jgi:hypothetical protein
MTRLEKRMKTRQQNAAHLRSDMDLMAEASRKIQEHAGDLAKG